MNNQNNTFKDEITKILEKIDVLQKSAVIEEVQEKYCDFGILGEETCRFECNTRPVMLFTDDDQPWHCPIESDEDECHEERRERTCVFRVEKVENGAVVLRALKEKNHDEDNRSKFKSTNSFITIKIQNISALRCLKDTFIDLCIR